MHHREYYERPQCYQMHSRARASILEQLAIHFDKYLTVEPTAKFASHP